MFKFTTFYRLRKTDLVERMRRRWKELVVLSRRDSGLDDALARGFRPEEQREHHEHGEGSERRHGPGGVPVVRHARIRRAPLCAIAVDNGARHRRADEIPHAVGHEIDEALRGGADLRTGALVGVDLAAHEEEVVAD